MKGLREPHFLLIGNPYTVIKNLHGIINPIEIEKIKLALLQESKLLFELSNSHFEFAKNINIDEWRQRSSRFYYAAYNCK